MKDKMHGGAGKEIYQRARELRNEETHAEVIMWGYLKTKPLDLKFRRKHPYFIYILDFYCHKQKLMIGVDGSIHSVETVKENDQARQILLEQDGLSVLRFTNEQVLYKLEEVIAVIEQYIKQKNSTTKNDSSTKGKNSPSGVGGKCNDLCSRIRYPI